MRVYIKTNSKNCITEINSELFIDDFSKWTKINEGEGDKFVHAQANYFPMPLTDDNGVYRYAYEGGAVRERTADELAADIAAIEPAPPSNAELAAAIAELAEVMCGG